MTLKENMENREMEIPKEYIITIHTDDGPVQASAQVTAIKDDNDIITMHLNCVVNKEDWSV